MNAKDLKTDSALGGHINDGSTKYAQSGSSHQNNANKSYHEIGPNTMVKVDVQTSRPCAIIGPDRVLPSQNCNDGYIKKTTAEPWPCLDNVYRQTSDYTHKISEYQPSRNISPRQTFQENMQRIMVSPYSSVKKSDDSNLHVDRNVSMLKDVKLNMPTEAKYCEVPYTVNPACNEQKSVRVTDMRVPNVNPGATRSTPHAWPHNNINVRPLRPYGVPELYQYPDYPSCTGPRPVPMVRPQRIVREEPGGMYPEAYYQDANIRFRPYPPTKGRYPHGRYEYVSNYNTFHPSPPFPPQAYDAQKSMPAHSYPMYPQAPLKYIDRRTGEPIMDGYQRLNPPQSNINVNYHNPVIHPPYGPLQSNCIQNNMFSYPSENSPKAVTLNKLPYTNNSKIYADYELLQNKKIPIADTVYANDVNRIHSMKGEVAYPNYAPVNVHGIPQHTIYRRENISVKNFDYMPHLKNLDHAVNFRNQFIRHPVHFSPNSIAISPSDSNTSNDANQTHSSSQEDCGYVSQSSTASGRSIDLHINGIPNEHHLYRSPDRYGFLPRNIQTQNPNNTKNSKVKKDINVRQFLQMWNEGDEELGEQSKEENISKDSNNLSCLPSQYESSNKQEQLYVLGLVNVPSEELDKYDHIQKISKLPENIKGYNNIELLNQFEEVIESTNMRTLSKAQRVPLSKQLVKTIPRPVSPLDVEAKISQSVIHKEVGCNFEIKPCSPKMLNVEIATPVENILEERTIEKVSNPITAQAVMVPKVDKINVESSSFSSSGSVISNNCEKTLNEVSATPSCNIDSLKYTNDNSLDLEYNSSVCLASLPRLDNEIELNFPEINQQFINANKIESLTPISFKDSSNLDSGQLNINIQHDKAGKMTELAKCSPNRDSDKEFTKLSKYRKLKKTDVDQKEMHNKPVVQDPIIKTQFRTDSVIIKNPENVRLHEVNLSPSIVHSAYNNTILNNTSIESSQNDKLTSNVTKDSLNSQSPSAYNAKENTSDAENAIDFSLNKSENVLKNIYPKESIANESFLNFIEENLNISESYEKTKSPINVNNHEFSVDNSKKIECTADATESNSIELSSNDKQEFDKNNDDLHLNSHLVEEDKKNNKPIQLELNNPTSKKIISTEIEMSGQNSLPTLLDDLNESSFNSLQNVVPEIGLKADDNSKSLTVLANTDVENEIHMDNYSNCGNNFESDKTDHQDKKNDLNDLTSEKCQMSYEESNLNSLNIEATKPINLGGENEDFGSENTDQQKKKNDLNDLTSETCQISYEESNLNSSNIEATKPINLGGENDDFESEKTDQQNKKNDLNDLTSETCQISYEESNLNSLNIEATKPLNLGCENDDFESEKTDQQNKKNDLNDLTSETCQMSYEESNLNSLNIEASKPPNLDGENDDFESEKTDHQNKKNDINDVTSETCHMSHGESNLNSLNIEATNSLNLDCENFEKSLECLIDSNAQMFEREVKIDCEYKIYKENNIVPEVSIIDQYKNVTKNSFNKRLYSPVILNLMIYNDGEPKEKKATQKITHFDLTPKVDSSKRNNCIDQSIYLEEYPALECETLSTEISTGCTESLQADIGCSEKSFDTKQYRIENSEKLSLNNTMGPVNEEFCLNANDDCTINASKKSDNFQNESRDIEKNSNKNCINNCLEKMDTPKEKCSHSIIEDNEMIPRNQIESSEKDEKRLDYYSFKELTNNGEHLNSKRSVRLKRSLSDSALNKYANEEDNNDSFCYTIPKKRKRVNPCELMEPKVIAQNLCNILQTNRRNSISTFYNEENVSFCILIDNSCDLIAENACAQKISLTEIAEDEPEEDFKEKCTMSTENIVFTEDSSHKITCCLIEDFDAKSKNDLKAQSSPENCFTPEYAISERNEDKSYDETWIEDVACIETVFSDDITEDIVLDPPSAPKLNHEPEPEPESEIHNESLIYNDIDHINKMKYIYGNEMCNDDVDLVETLYRTPQMDLRKTLIRRESQYSDETTRYYDNDSLEKILSESNYKEVSSDSESGKLKTNIAGSDTIQSKIEQDDKENLKYELSLQNSFNCKPGYHDSDCYDRQHKSLDNNMHEPTQYDVVHSCEFTSPYKITSESPRYSNSSSPEVSSTTSEEKSCGILLKITNCNGSISSQLNDCNAKNTNKSIPESPEKKELINYNYNPTRSRPLLTKAAQKYIPPLKETIPDLKVKLPLPKHSLNKLKILKISKDKPKLDKPVSKIHTLAQPQYPKKNKPKFEDVLKSIDDIQIKRHKEKNKKQKHSIPKVVIKKNENGAHYTSTSNDIEPYNPDLTGRKWQPWVFIEKNYFIDKMALNKKAKAVFNYRKNTYVLAEKFRKYKSVHNAKFVISQPKMEDISSGKLKYTIRLKHNY